MKTKFAYILTLCGSLISPVTMAEPIQKSGFTVAVISEEPSSVAIKNGLYKKGLSLISKRVNANPFYQAMNLCVVSIKSDALNDSGEACNKAVKLISNIKKPNTSRLKAIAYSNRAIKNYLSNDINRAEMDFKRAAALSNDKVVVKNVKYFNELLDL